MKGDDTEKDRPLLGACPGRLSIMNAAFPVLVVKWQTYPFAEIGRFNSFTITGFIHTYSQSPFHISPLLTIASAYNYKQSIFLRNLIKNTLSSTKYFESEKYEFEIRFTVELQ